MENKFKLNDSNKICVSVGIEPKQNGEFIRTIVIEENIGRYLCFTRGQFVHLLKLICAIPEMCDHNIKFKMDHVNELNCDDGEKTYDVKSREVYEHMSIENAKTWYDHIFNLKHLHGNVGRLLIGCLSLQRLLQMHKAILFVYDNINHVRVQNEFFKIVEKARLKGIDKPIIDKQELYEFLEIDNPKIFFGIDRQKLREFLMKHVFDVFDFDNPSFAYSVAVQTQSKFQDYFEQILKYDIENPY